VYIKKWASLSGKFLDGVENLVEKVVSKVHVVRLIRIVKAQSEKGSSSVLYELKKVVADIKNCPSYGEDL